MKIIFHRIFIIKDLQFLTGDDIKLSERLSIPTSNLEDLREEKLDLKMVQILLEEII